MTEEEARAARQQRNEALAAAHTGEECPRSPDEQVGKTPETAIWTRRLITHINYGGGKHGYFHEYTCRKCNAKVSIGS